LEPANECSVSSQSHPCGLQIVLSHVISMKNE
jgi:hypothetical protein